MNSLTLTPLPRPFSATIKPPGSKSLTNRALVVASLADGQSRISNILIADDTRVMLDGLRTLGFTVEIDATSALIYGLNGKIPASGADIYCGNSGTTIRFLTALCSLGHGEFHLDGDSRMRQRPIAPLIDLLEPLGARINCTVARGRPPVTVHASGLSGGRTSFSSKQSSQFLSAVLMAAPAARGPVTVVLDGLPTSRPYVQMTIELMERFSVTVNTAEPGALSVRPSSYHPADYVVEPDASSASYFLATAAISPGSRVTVPGLGNGSLQGDTAFAGVLREMGAHVDVAQDHVSVTGAPLHGIDIDMSDMPDMAMTLAVVALFASGPSTIRGLHTLPLKESDRLSALRTELSRLGAAVQTSEDSIQIQPPGNVQSAEIETYADHRMAMSFAVAGTRVGGITIRDPGCVAKTYPGFWEDLESLRG